MSNTQIKNKPWDKFYSSYYWNIYLDPDNPRNVTEMLTGYSKKVNENEAQDKDNLLKSKILNLYTNSYFNNSLKIEFFAKTDFVIDKKKDPCILILYPNAYKIPPTNGEYMVKRFGVFLEEFYQRKKKGLAMEGLIPRNGNRTSLDQLFDVTRYNFKTEAHLLSRCAQFLTYGHPSGQVTAFMNKYKQLKGW